MDAGYQEFKQGKGKKQRQKCMFLSVHADGHTTLRLAVGMVEKVNGKPCANIIMNYGISMQRPQECNAEAAYTGASQSGV